MKYSLGRYGYLLLMMAAERPVWGLVKGPRPAVNIYDIPDEDVPDWVPGRLGFLPNAKTHPRHRLWHILKNLENKALVKRRWAASRPTRTLQWTITDKGRRWLRLAEKERLGALSERVRHASSMPWRSAKVRGKPRWYCPGLLDYSWQGIIEKRGRSYWWQLTNPDGVCSGWLKADIGGLAGAKAEVEATFRKYA